MQNSRLITTLVPAVSLVALIAFAPANAVPCGPYSTHGGIKVGATDLGASSATCQNSVLGDANNSVDDLNAGAGFFNTNNWTELTKVDEGQFGNSTYWTFKDAAKPEGTPSGKFTLTAGIWDIYSKLVVVLKDGGSTLNKNIKWSAYLLPTGVYDVFNWSYDNRKDLSHASLYGIRAPTTSVPEPATFALLGIGLTGAVVALRRKRAR